MGVTADQHGTMPWIPSRQWRQHYRKQLSGDPLESLSREEHSKLQELQRILHAEQCWSHDSHDLYMLRRFLKARDWDILRAKQMWQEMLAFRANNRVDTILHEFHFHERDKVLAAYPHGLHKVDKEGRPVLAYRFGAVDLEALERVTNQQRLTQFHIQEYERIMHCVLPACSLLAGRHIEKIVTLIDVAGIRMRDISKVMEMLSSYIKVDSNNYPETLGAMIIINAPMWFSGSFALVKRMLSVETQKKVQIFGSSYHAALHAIIPAENLLPEFGGSSQGSLADGHGPWIPMLKRMHAEELQKQQQEQQQQQQQQQEAVKDVVKKPSYTVDAVAIHDTHHGLLERSPNDAMSNQPSAVNSQPDAQSVGQLATAQGAHSYSNGVGSQQPIEVLFPPQQPATVGQKHPLDGGEQMGNETNQQGFTGEQRDVRARHNEDQHSTASSAVHAVPMAGSDGTQGSGVQSTYGMQQSPLNQGLRQDVPQGVVGNQTQQPYWPGRAQPVSTGHQQQQQQQQPMLHSLPSINEDSSSPAHAQRQGGYTVTAGLPVGSAIAADRQQHPHGPSSNTPISQLVAEASQQLESFYSLSDNATWLSGAISGAVSDVSFVTHVNTQHVPAQSQQLRVMTSGPSQAAQVDPLQTSQTFGSPQSAVSFMTVDTASLMRQSMGSPVLATVPAQLALLQARQQQQQQQHVSQAAQQQPMHIPPGHAHGIAGQQYATHRSALTASGDYSSGQGMVPRTTDQLGDASSIVSFESCRESLDSTAWSMMSHAGGDTISPRTSARLHTRSGRLRASEIRNSYTSMSLVKEPLTEHESPELRASIDITGHQVPAARHVGSSFPRLPRWLGGRGPMDYQPFLEDQPSQSPPQTQYLQNHAHPSQQHPHTPTHALEVGMPPTAAVATRAQQLRSPGSDWEWDSASSIMGSSPAMQGNGNNTARVTSPLQEPGRASVAQSPYSVSADPRLARASAPAVESHAHSYMPVGVAAGAASAHSQPIMVGGMTSQTYLALVDGSTGAIAPLQQVPAVPASANPTSRTQMVQDYIRMWLRGAADAFAKPSPSRQQLLDSAELSTSPAVLNDVIDSMHSGGHPQLQPPDIKSSYPTDDTNGTGMPAGATGVAGATPAVTKLPARTRAEMILAAGRSGHSHQRSRSGGRGMRASTSDHTGVAANGPAGAPGTLAPGVRLPAVSYEVYVDSDEDEVGGLLPRPNAPRKQGVVRRLFRHLCCCVL